MKKSTLAGLLGFLVAAILCFAFFAWGTNWFSSTVRLRKLFGDEAVTVSETVEHGLNKSSANDGNIYLDSDDTETTVAVKYAADPWVLFVDDCLQFHYQYSVYIGLKMKVRIGLKDNFEATAKDFEFDNEIAYPESQNHMGSPINIHKISVSELNDFVSSIDSYTGVEELTVQAFTPGFSNVICGQVLDSKLVSYDFYYVSGVQSTLSGTTLTVTLSDMVDCSSSTYFSQITFSPSGDATSQIFMPGANGLTLNGNVITIDLAKLDLISSNYSGVVNVSILYGHGNSLRYVFDGSVDPFGINKLEAPTGITLSASGLLSWNAVDGAQGYKIFFEDDTDIFTSEPQYDFYGKPEARYNIRIRAEGNVGARLAKEATAFNASLNIVSLVCLTYDIDGDTVTKFVPHGKTFSDYLYDVEVEGYSFGGWYYDSGFSRKVEATDKLDKDTTIYARLSDAPVTDRPLSWWELHKWQVLIPVFVAAGLAVMAVTAVAVKKKRSGK